MNGSISGETFDLPDGTHGYAEWGSPQKKRAIMTLYVMPIT